NTAADDHIAMLPPDKIAEYRARHTVWEEKTKAIRAEIAAVLETPKKKILKEFFDKYPPEIQAAILKPAAERNPFEWQMYAKAKPYLEIPGDDAVKALKGEQKSKYESLKKELDQFKDLYPGEFPEGIGMADLSRHAPATHVLSVGVYDAPKEEVQPGFLSLLDPTDAKVVPPANLNSTGRRTALANWLTDPANPLPARVMVNRIWHYHFGQGIVGTPSDFGAMGERPTHPELLDWLAKEFVRSGWSMKHM